MLPAQITLTYWRHTHASVTTVNGAKDTWHFSAFCLAANVAASQKLNSDPLNKFAMRHWFISH